MSVAKISSEGAPWDGWALTTEQRAVYIVEFQKYRDDVENDGYVSGGRTKELLLGSGVAVEDLVTIWNLSDIDKDNRLSLDEYCIARFLVDAVKIGQKIPATLPETVAITLPSNAGDDAPIEAPPVSVTTTAKSEKGKKSSKSKDGRSKRSKSKKDKKSSIRVNKKDKKRQVERRKSGRKASKSSASNGSTPWAITSEQFARYTKVFETYQDEGHIDGAKSVQLFSKSQLERPELGQIWALSDMDQDSKLNYKEFLVAMHLITMKLNGYDIPQAVPNELVSVATSLANGEAPEENSFSASGSEAKVSASMPSNPTNMSASVSGLSSDFASLDVGFSGGASVAVSGSGDVAALQEQSNTLASEIAALMVEIEKQKALVTTLPVAIEEQREEGRNLLATKGQLEQEIAALEQDRNADNAEENKLEAERNALLENMQHSQGDGAPDTERLQHQRNELEAEKVSVQQEFSANQKLIESLRLEKQQLEQTQGGNVFGAAFQDGGQQVASNPTPVANTGTDVFAVFDAPSVEVEASASVEVQATPSIKRERSSKPKPKRAKSKKRIKKVKETESASSKDKKKKKDRKAPKKPKRST
mmetsp:Transcript_25040/g.27848  ORF Transcript_25040/g.27848 Transcript_25040/m.27848 type:complete len:590 (+) Transcript_25040:170-1939(+)|eukprot:CAMPEP_0168514132 /NCGR_PEP_ID=MMETSP0405-20121227/3916_1 /TAXON_ID=498012 /ORGANISM="Trichosphaerium sp, Strain Am-I-7 wt" /LENGTH=589 /DNA_ID=CAMNT_0008533177 /DNA_START=94 /DNA_END=1863 /DNA_ORIENTATION=-